MIVTKIAIAGLMLAGLSACGQTRAGLHATPAFTHAFQAVQPPAGMAKGTALKPGQSRRQSVSPITSIPIAQGDDTRLNLTAGRPSENEWLGGISFSWKF